MPLLDNYPIAQRLFLVTLHWGRHVEAARDQCWKAMTADMNWESQQTWPIPSHHISSISENHPSMCKFRGLRNTQPMISWSSHSIAVSAFAQAAHNARHCAMLPGSSDLLALVSQRWRPCHVSPVFRMVVYGSIIIYKYIKWYWTTGIFNIKKPINKTFGQQRYAMDHHGTSDFTNGGTVADSPRFESNFSSARDVEPRRPNSISRSGNSLGIWESETNSNCLGKEKC